MLHNTWFVMSLVFKISKKAKIPVVFNYTILDIVAATPIQLLNISIQVVFVKLVD